MPIRKRYRRSPTALHDSGCSPIGQWVIDRMATRYGGIPVIASRCGVNYPIFSSFIYGKLPFPRGVVSCIGECLQATSEDMTMLYKLQSSFVSKRQAAAINRKKKYA